MKEERNIITIDEYGKLKMPSDKNGAVADIWMSEAELVELFGTTTGAVHGSIKAIFKENILHNYEVSKYVRLENGNGADVYNMEVVVALVFRLNTCPLSFSRNCLVV